MTRVAQINNYVSQWKRELRQCFLERGVVVTR